VELTTRHSREVSIDYLRAFITILVLLHHSALAYTTFAHFDVSNYLASTAPIVDSHRWIVLDYVENFNDVFFMSLMFFISGLFVWRALKRKGVSAFLRDRVLRLGVPFLVGTVFLMPLAYYPSFLEAGGNSAYVRYWFDFLSGPWPPGPLWFLWLLLVFDLLAATLFLIVGPKQRKQFSIRSGIKAFLALFGIGFFVYLPMLAHFGFSAWIPLGLPPLYFQPARFFLYLTWFVFGAIVGTAGTSTGIIAEGGPLARHWPLWLAACVIVYNLLWFVPPALANPHVSKPLHDLTYVILWVLSCCASCFGFVALFRGTVRKHRKWMDSVVRAAYMMYIVHYVFVIWTQYLLLPVSAPAEVKFVITLAATIAASWLTASLVLRVRILRSVL